MSTGPTFISARIFLAFKQRQRCSSWKSKPILPQRMPCADIGASARTFTDTITAVAGDDLDEIGMLCDFKVIKRLLKQVLEPIDHQYLNETELFRETNPTTENLAKYIFRQTAAEIQSSTAGRASITRVKVWETDNCSAAYFPSK